MRKSHVYLALTTITTLLLIALMGAYPVFTDHRHVRRWQREGELVARLELTDICLFTEASYLRHPNLADRFVPFQDHPMAISLFPSESLLNPPAQLLRAAPLAEKAPRR